jgi:membrane protein implicated in regulation of membrane protease activity
MFTRYLLWQAPSWIVTAAIAAVLVTAAEWPWWPVGATVGVLVVRDIALYPAMRATFRAAAPPQPIGRRGVSVDPLQPVGLVRVDGELWRAQALGADIPAGREIVVTGARGLVLVVERADGE